MERPSSPKRTCLADGESGATGVSACGSDTTLPSDSLDLGYMIASACGSFEDLRQLGGSMDDTQRFKYLTSHSTPLISDVLHSHQVTKQGKSWKVSFQLQWLQKFPWLSYSNVLEGGICRHCVLFPEKPNRGGSQGAKPGVLVLSAYQRPYTKALGKDGILVCHERSLMHRHATESADLFRLSYDNPSTRVDSRLLKQQEQQAEKNREILRQIVYGVEYLAKQGLPFRGHREDKIDFSVSSVNRGNFIALMQLLGKSNTTLQEHLLHCPKNAKYTSKTIQNEIIHIYACKLREKLTSKLKENDLPFTIIADEVTDHHANQEVLSVCLRFVDLTSPQDPHIKECLINLINVERANASTIATKILESISHPSISLNPRNIRGQAYDGASVMSSEKAGVQAKIKEISPLALYTHCYAHTLNLSIAASCKVQEVRNLIDTINESYLFLNHSPKRQRFFERALNEYLPACRHSKLPGLCKTRWVERHTCYEVFLEMYECFVTFLDAIISPGEYQNLLLDDDENWNWDRETKIKAQGLKSSLSSFQCVAVFIITKNILDEVKPLASKFQKQDCDIGDAYKLVDSSIENIRSIREKIDETFSSWYNSEIIPLADNIGVSECVPRKTSLQRNRSNVPSNTPMEHYKRAIAIPLLDSLLGQMKERFSEDQRHAQGLLRLLPSVIISENEPVDRMLESLQFYEGDLPFPRSLGNELRRWNALWHKKGTENVSGSGLVPSNLLLTLGACDRDSFPNIHRLLIIACTLPISSAEAERSFSLVRRLKTYLRSTMAEERLSDLSIIAMHYGERIPIDEVCHTFVQAHPRKLFQVSLFDNY